MPLAQFLYPPATPIHQLILLFTIQGDKLFVMTVFVGSHTVSYLELCILCDFMISFRSLARMLKAPTDRFDKNNFVTRSLNDHRIIIAHISKLSILQFIKQNHKENAVKI